MTITIAKRQEISKAFAKAYGGNMNFITPEFWEYGYSQKDNTLFYEISIGSGIFDRDSYIVGVTVVDNLGNRKYDLSRSFAGPDKNTLLRQAKKYGDSLTS